jgi:hypothetical protein
MFVIMQNIMKCPVFRFIAMSTAVKFKIYQTMVNPAVVFGGETWAVAEMDMNRLGTREREILRRIHGPVVVLGMWRIRTDQELK